MGFCPKNTFLQLKHYKQRIRLTLFSTTCVKIHQITYVIFETISYFSRHDSSVSFQLKHYILSTRIAHQKANFQISTAQVKVHQIPYVIFETISHFSQHNSSVCFQLKHYILHTAYKSSPSKCKFSDFPLLRLEFTKFLISFFK